MWNMCGYVKKKANKQIYDIVRRRRMGDNNNDAKLEIVKRCDPFSYSVVVLG